MSSNIIAAHIRSCLLCRSGISRLSKALIVQDELTCEQCRARFPTYYEATRPEYPLVQMPESEMREVVIHLGHCASCRGEYAALVELWRLEENGDISRVP